MRPRTSLICKRRAGPRIGAPRLGASRDRVNLPQTHFVQFAAPLSKNPRNSLASSGWEMRCGIALSCDLQGYGLPSRGDNVLTLPHPRSEGAPFDSAVRSVCYTTQGLASMTDVASVSIAGLLSGVRRYSSRRCSALRVFPAKTLLIGTRFASNRRRRCRPAARPIRGRRCLVPTVRKVHRHIGERSVHGYSHTECIGVAFRMRVCARGRISVRKLKRLGKLVGSLQRFGPN
jgi:hypothetical protein